MPRAHRYCPRRRPRTSPRQIDPYDDPTSLKYLSRSILESIDVLLPDSFSFGLPLPDGHPPADPDAMTDSHSTSPTTELTPQTAQNMEYCRMHLKQDIVDFACRVRPINIFTEDEVTVDASYVLNPIQDDVDEVIEVTGDVPLMHLQNTLTMIAHALLRHFTQCVTPQYNLIDILSKSESNRSDRPRDMSDQNFATSLRTRWPPAFQRPRDEKL